MRTSPCLCRVPLIWARGARAVRFSIPGAPAEAGQTDGIRQNERMSLLSIMYGRVTYTILCHLCFSLKNQGCWHCCLQVLVRIDGRRKQRDWDLEAVHDTCLWPRPPV